MEDWNAYEVTDKPKTGEMALRDLLDSFAIFCFIQLSVDPLVQEISFKKFSFLPSFSSSWHTGTLTEFGE